MVSHISARLRPPHGSDADSEAVKGEVARAMPHSSRHLQIIDGLQDQAIEFFRMGTFDVREDPLVAGMMPVFVRVPSRTRPGAEAAFQTARLHAQSKTTMPDPG